MDLTLERLGKLDVGSLESVGAWSVGRIFDHLAQSIEFSMHGFPVMKSRVFQKTAGQLAFNVFQARGRMSHTLDELIPGELVVDRSTPEADGHQRLILALEQFATYEGLLKPHFAYGELDKQQYALANAMHINNHLEEFQTL